MVQIVLGLIKLALMVFSWMQAKKYIDIGQDRAVAEATTALLLATQTGRELRREVNAATDQEADKLWEDMMDV